MRISDWSSDVCSSDLDHRADLAAGELRAEAEVGAAPEAEQLVGVGAADVEGVGVDEHVLIAVGRRVRQQHPPALGDLDATDHLVLGGPAQEVAHRRGVADDRSEEHTSELQSLMRNSYAVFC